MLLATVLHLICLRQESTPNVDLIKQIVASGRCVTLAESPVARTDRKLQIAPGQPPLLLFRYYEGKLHQRVGNNNLMMDDAGH